MKDVTNENCLRMLFLTLGVFVLTVGSVWAQTDVADPGAAGGKSWVLSYFLVGLGIVLGLVVICRPGKRTAEVKKPVE